MLPIVQIPPIDIQKKLARISIQENRLEEALDIYLDILQNNPDDPEILKVLGELYLAAGNGKTAKEIFRRAAQTNPMDEEIYRQIEKAGNSDNPDCSAELAPTSPEAVKRLIQNLTHREQPISEDELNRAAKLLKEIVDSSKPSAEVAKRLDEIDNLLPALIDLNIRQAKVNGRSDLATGLQNLKTNVRMQKFIFTDAGHLPGMNNRNNFNSVEKFTGRVAVFQPENEDLGINDRVRMLKSALLSNGILVSENENAIECCDLAVFNNPFLDPSLMEKMAKFSTAKIPIILDLDQYFDQVSISKIINLTESMTSQSVQRSYASSLILADLITVTTGAMAESLRASGYPVMIIPNGWSIENPYWAEKMNSRETTLQMGWFGNTGNLDDLAVIRRPIIRLLREFEGTLRLIIVGDQDAYRMFDHIPEGMRTFIPCLDKTELPFIINQMDIVLAPSRNTAANQMRSDEILMYAGIKKIPWAATAIPAVNRWEKGGLICSTLEEWHTGLRHLILDRDLRQSLGDDGFHASARREMLLHIQHWYKAFNLVQPSTENNISTNKPTIIREDNP